MLRQSEREAIEKGFVILTIIWIAMLGSLLAYVIVCHLFCHEIQKAANTQLPVALLKHILFGLSLVTLILIHYLRRLMLAVRTDVPRVTRSEPHSYSSQPQALGKYTAAVFVSLALSDTIGIFGIVMFFLGATFQTLYIFIIISALAMVFYRPKKEELAEFAIALQAREAQSSNYLH